MGQGSGPGAQRETGQEAGWGGGLGWRWVRASLDSLSKYGRFFCLHLSHAGHGPRDLLSRYCRRDTAPPPAPHPPLPAWGSAQPPSSFRGRSRLHRWEPSTHPSSSSAPRERSLGPQQGHTPTLPLARTHTHILSLSHTHTHTHTPAACSSPTLALQGRLLVNRAIQLILTEQLLCARPQNKHGAPAGPPRPKRSHSS